MPPPHRLHIRWPGWASQGTRVDPTTHTKESITMPRVFAAILLVAVLALGGGLIATPPTRPASARRHDRHRERSAPSSPRSSSRPTATGTAGTPRLRLGDLRLLRRPVLPVHRVRPDPGHLLARRPGPPRRLGRTRLGRPRRLALGEPARTTPSTTGTARRTTRPRARPPRRRRARRPGRPDRSPSPLPAPPDRCPGAHPALRCDR